MSKRETFTCRKNYLFVWWILTTGLMPSVTVSQTYLKALQESDKYFNQQIICFPNGDLLIGDSSLGPLRNERTDGKVVMLRLDQCGNIIWGYSYSLGPGYLEFRDFSINESNEILAYGSYFNGLDELLFLLEINGETGKKANFRLFDPKTMNGFFAYSLVKRNNQAMVFGFLVNPNIGLIAFFDERFNVTKAYKVTPFEANGEAIIDNEGKIVARSGNNLFKMSTGGELEWAYNLNISTVNGPIEVGTGHIWVGHRGGISFFYKTNAGGQLVWQSEPFFAVEMVGVMTILDNKNILFTYNCPFDVENRLCQIILSPDGQILDRRRLIIDQTMNLGIVSQAINNADWITIAGNANAFVPERAEIEDFILQFPLDERSNNCIRWESFEPIITNPINLEFTPIDLSVEDFDLEQIQALPIEIDTFSYSLIDFCEAGTIPDQLERDTILPCDQDWLVELPEPGFFWSDGSNENPRLIEKSGIYRARNSDCNHPVVLIFNLSKDDCGCPVFLPNAFSPNDDGINDQLIYQSQCPLEKVQLKVFNRFGGLVYSSDRIDQFWNGTYRRMDAPSGVYVVTLDYEWISQAGKLQRQSIYQEIMLIR